MLIIEAIVFSLLLIMSGEEKSTLEFSLSLALQWLTRLLVKVSHFYCYLPISCPTPSKEKHLPSVSLVPACNLVLERPRQENDLDQLALCSNILSQKKIKEK